MAFLAELKPHGACDHVDGLGHVETEFWSVATLPLIPTRSYLLGPNGHAIPMPLQPRSLTAAYLRAAILMLGIATTAGGVLMLMMPSPSAEHTVVQLVSVVVGLAFLGVSSVVPRLFWEARPEGQARLREFAANATDSSS